LVLNMMQFKLSTYGKRSSVPSAVNEMTGEFADNFREGIDINLGVGYVNDKTIPAKEIIKAYDQVIHNPEKYRNVLNYGGAEGSIALRNSIRNYYIRNNIGGLTERELTDYRILIGSDGATSILDSFADIIDPGYVITADPYYYIYTETLKRKGFDLLPIEEDDRGIRVDILKKTLRNIDIGKISFLYIVTVNNPTGTILSNERKKSIVEISISLSEKLKRKIPVIFDKAYEDIIHDAKVPLPISGLKYNTLDNVFELGTLSKVIAPALRIGYLIAKDNIICKLLIQRTSDIGFSASLLNQEIASWLLDHHIQIQKEKVNLGYRHKSLAIQKLLKSKLSKYLSDLRGGSAGFYFYLTLDRIETNGGSRFYKFLSRTTGDPAIDGDPVKLPRLIYVPGTVCSISNTAKYQLRLSYGFEDIAVFEKAIDLIREACEYSRS